ncbi:MAG: PspC domain-containing protein [Ignavibacteriales bacterium]|nr:PspC domain-containing protein [Ignavibacteriales bacterium]
MLPVLFILLGAFFIYLHSSKKKDNNSTTAEESAKPGLTGDGQKELRRCRANRKLFGVCCGLAKYFGIDPTLVRFIFVGLILLSFGWGLLIYIILGIIMPEEKLSVTSA